MYTVNQYFFLGKENSKGGGLFKRIFFNRDSERYSNKKIRENWRSDLNRNISITNVLCL